MPSPLRVRATVNDRLLAAAGPNTSAEDLSVLARDRSRDVRRGVAINPNLSHGDLGLLARDPDAEVRVRVAKNPSVPVDVLIGLGSDASQYVKGTAAFWANARLCATLGIDRHNTEAIAYLREQEWWSLSDDDPAVVLAKTLYPNA